MTINSKDLKVANKKVTINKGGKVMNTRMSTPRIPERYKGLLSTGSLNIKKFNAGGLLGKEQTIQYAEYAGLKVLSAEEWQKLHKDSISPREQVIARIDRNSIKWEDNYVEAMFDEKNGFRLYYDGLHQKIVNGKWYKKKHKKDYNKNGDPKHAIIKFDKVCNRYVGVEAMILMLSDLDNDTMLEEYNSDLHCNVMSDTGNLTTALKLGYKKRWLDRVNLEWTPEDDNIKHGNRYKKLCKITGKRWMASANDAELWAKVAGGNKEEIIRYCNKNLIQIN